jgi:hypothetical protein
MDKKSPHKIIHNVSTVVEHRSKIKCAAFGLACAAACSSFYFAEALAICQSAFCTHFLCLHCRSAISANNEIYADRQKGNINAL